MRVSKKNIKVIYCHIKKAEEQEKINQAFDILFDEIFRLMNEEPAVATK